MWKVNINIEGLSKLDKKTLLNKILVYGGFVLSFVVGILIGYLFIIIYQQNILEDQTTFQKNKEKSTELNLLISKNSELITKYDSLLTEVSKLKTIYSANNLVKDSIQNYKMLLGETRTKGAGIILTIDINLPDYWLIDILNELFDLGAEAISINDIRITSKTAILRDDAENQILINNVMIEKPYRFSIIGNPDILEKGLKTNNGLISRLEENFPNKKKNITIQASEILLEKNI